MLITAGLDAEAGDHHRREAAWNVGVRMVVRVAADEHISPLVKVVVDASVGFSPNQRHLCRLRTAHSEAAFNTPMGHNSPATFATPCWLSPACEGS
jgi:hypothetical protein